MMAQQARRPRHLPDEDDDTISISIKGDKVSVARLIAAMAQVMNGEAPQAAPEPLYVLRDEASRLTGIPRDKLSNLVKLGAITNYGSPAKLRFSLAELRAWQESQR